MKRPLNIVDKDDKIIGVKEREEIHEKGLLHREVGVYFVTRNKEVIFQHRAKDKDLFPDMLDATVGGHVEIGHSYEESALKETEEETGLKIAGSDLIFLNKTEEYFDDLTTGKSNHTFNYRYAYVYDGDIKDLKVEEGKAIGFEAWPIDKLSALSDSDKARFIPFVLRVAVMELAEFIKGLKL
jgi:isopentenyldiphosphate isomerase